MVMTDPIADLLTRIRNANQAKHETVKIPVIGIGGIGNWKDAAEFILAGASAVQIGTANFINANVCKETAEGLNEYLERKNISNFNEIVGKAVS